MKQLCSVVFVLLLVIPGLAAVVEVDTSNATASAWSVHSSYPAANSLDGNFNSFWTNDRGSHPTTDGAGDWYQVDWPGDVEIGFIRTEGRSFQSGFYSIPQDVRLHFSDGSTLDFNFDDTTQDHWVQEYDFYTDQQTTDFVKIEFLTYYHHVWEYIQYYEVDFYYDDDTGDTIPPEVTGQDPADGAVDVPVDSDIVFHATDDNSGIDTATIDFTAEDTTLSGGALTMVSPLADISGTLDVDDTDPLDVICTFTADADLPADTITCTVAGTLADNAGNTMGSDEVWSFDTVGADVEPASWGQIKSLD